MAEFIRGKPKTRFRGIKLTDGELSFQNAGYNMTFVQSALTAAGTITIPAIGDRQLLTSTGASVLISGTALIAWPAIGTTLAATSGTLTITGLALNSVVLVSRLDSGTTNGVVALNSFVSAADSLHVVFGSTANSGIAAGTATLSYIYTTP
mgnify:CR=1 FL=1